jgi:prepilin-type N-terminal cleavage/methylation domain-containing protein
LIVLRPSFRILAGCRGFSMIEAIVVLIIIAIIAPIILSQAFKQTDTTPLISEAEILKSSLRYAQIRAMNDTVRWGINLASATTYTLVRTGYTAPNLPGDSSATHALSSKVTLSSGVGTTVLFNDWGVPVDGAGSPLSSNTTITLTQSGQTSTITITKNTGYIP